MALACLLGSATAPSHAATIHIRIINARTGKPIAHVGASAHQSPPVPYATIPNQPATDSNGVITVELPEDATVAPTVYQYPTCTRVPKAEWGSGANRIPVKDIVATGVVRPNNCTHRTASPTPGELTLFVRPLRWYERLSY